MGWQPDAEPGPDGESDPNERLTGGPGEPRAPGGPGIPRSPEGAPRDARPAGFTRGGEWDSCAPSAALAVALAGASGPQWRCPGAERDELFGLLRRWAALESWAAAGKMGLLRALMREEDLPLSGGSHHGDLPDGWSRSLTHEVALALAMPPQSAESLMWTAWDLQALLPGIGRLLADGTLTPAKARAIDEALAPLSEKDMARAEAMILPHLNGKTYGQAEKLAVQAAITADPQSAARRREDAERNRAKVSLRRGPSGAANLSGYDLPTDETLAAHAQVCARAAEYKDSGVFPDVRIDQLRARAYLDILNGITAAARIAAGQPDSGLGAPGEGPEDEGPEDEGPEDEGPEDEGPEDEGPADGGPADGGPADGGPADGGPRGPGGVPPENGGRSPGPGPGAGPGSGDGPGRRRGADDAEGGRRRGAASPPPPPPPPRSDPSPSAGYEPEPASATPPSSSPAPKLANLVVPLATLLGLAWRPGEGHGLGPLDPDLCRALASIAVNSSRSTLCLTVTDPRGFAIGHGCARPAPPPARAPAHAPTPTPTPAPTPAPAPAPVPEPPGASRTATGPPGAVAPLPALPARLSLTISSTLLAELAARAQSATQDRPGDRGPHGAPGRHQPGLWSLARGNDPGPPGGYGTWELARPDGTILVVKLEPVPTFDCDHRHEAHAYKPGDVLRHLVQIRDQECTFPTCSRHARDSDFEHAIPYHRGGRTCGCNAGARSRRCHQVKQSPGWKVTQPRPGWHQWETPSGRMYRQEPRRYPV